MGLNPHPRPSSLELSACGKDGLHTGVSQACRESLSPQGFSWSGLCSQGGMSPPCRKSSGRRPVLRRGGGWGPVSPVWVKVPGGGRSGEAPGPVTMLAGLFPGDQGAGKPIMRVALDSCAPPEWPLPALGLLCPSVSWVTSGHPCADLISVAFFPVIRLLNGSVLFPRGSICVPVQLNHSLPPQTSLLCVLFRPPRFGAEKWVFSFSWDGWSMASPRRSGPGWARLDS